MLSETSLRRFIVSGLIHKWCQHIEGWEGEEGGGGGYGSAEKWRWEQNYERLDRERKLDVGGRGGGCVHPQRALTLYGEGGEPWRHFWMSL